MEMDLNNLDINTLPTGEQRFIQSIASGCYLAYAMGFQMERATLGQLANHFMYLNEFANIALMRIGSGGRFEGAGLGDCELVLLTKDSMGERWEPSDDDGFGRRVYPAQYFDILKRTTGTDIYGVGPTPYMKVTLEHKQLDGPNQLSYHPNSSTPFPGRVLEGEYIAGNSNLVKEARRQVFDEIVSDPKIIKGMKKDLKTYKKVCQTGISRKAQQFHRDRNEVYFNPPAQQFGLKYGLLRYTQTALSIQLFELIQRQQIPVDMYLDLNQSVEERIRYAFRMDWVANEEDMIAAGIMYIKAADFNSKAKIRYYSDETTIFRTTDGWLTDLHDEITRIFEATILVN